MKICAKCKIEKDDNCFTITQLNKLSNGLNSGKCKICVKEKNIKYQEEHKDELKEYRKDCYERNKEEIKKNAREYYHENKDILNERKKEYRQENKDELNEKKRGYYQENKEEILERNMVYYQENKHDINEQRKGYKRNLRKNNPIYKLHCDISRAISYHLADSDLNKNNKSINELLPYTMQELKDHLEPLFEPWMNWNNRGKYNKKTWNDKDSSTWMWQIDHIIPKSKFKIKKEGDEEFQKSWALSNLRPLSAKQNVKDGNRRK